MQQHTGTHVRARPHPQTRARPHPRLHDIHASAISQWGTDGLNRDGTLKHSYPDDKWVLVPLGHWNWKWNQARGNTRKCARALAEEVAENCL